LDLNVASTALRLPEQSERMSQLGASVGVIQLEQHLAATDFGTFLDQNLADGSRIGRMSFKIQDRFHLTVGGDGAVDILAAWGSGRDANPERPEHLEESGCNCNQEYHSGDNRPAAARAVWLPVGSICHE
jgi:hypothetical protein